MRKTSVGRTATAASLAGVPAAKNLASGFERGYDVDCLDGSRKSDFGPGLGSALSSITGCHPVPGPRISAWRG